MSLDFDKLDLDKQDSNEAVGDVENIDMRRQRFSESKMFL